MTERRNPQVNCKEHECFHNTDGKCYRSGIHASSKSCGCYVSKDNVERMG